VFWDRTSPPTATLPAYCEDVLSKMVVGDCRDTGIEAVTSPGKEFNNEPKTVEMRIGEAHFLLTKTGVVQSERTSQPLSLQSSPPGKGSQSAVVEDVGYDGKEVIFTRPHYRVVPVVPCGYPRFEIVCVPRLCHGKLGLSRDDGDGSIGNRGYD
jgi:hypothetical protein